MPPAPMPGAKLKIALTDYVRGAFGQFTAAGADQIAFVNTRFNKELLERVSTAREVIPRKQLKIRELIQRDIDDERVRDDIVAYLRPRRGGVDRPRFFPPIVVAVFPVGPSKAEPIARHYPPAVRPDNRFPRANDPEEGIPYEVWQYGDAFRVKIPLDASDEGKTD